MNPEVKKLEEAYVAKGGTKEEFHEKRSKIMKRAAKVREDNNSFDAKEVEYEVKKGTKRPDAIMEVSAEKIAALEARGFGDRR